MYNRKKGLCEGRRDDRSWIITLCMTAIFAYMTLKQNGLKRFVPGSILAGIALITYVISILLKVYQWI